MKEDDKSEKKEEGGIEMKELIYYRFGKKYKKVGKDETIKEGAMMSYDGSELIPIMNVDSMTIGSNPSQFSDERDFYNPIKEKGKNKMMSTITLKDTVKNIIEKELKNNQMFTVTDVMNELVDGDVNMASVRVCITRDLVRQGFIRRLENISRGRYNLYRYIEIKEEIPDKDEKSYGIEFTTNKEIIPSLEYSDVGIAIELLIETKNKDITKLKEEIRQLVLESIDKDGMIQERDRHISEQGKKIHELNEKIRKRSGGTIKLDELQDLIKI